MPLFAAIPAIIGGIGSAAGAVGGALGAAGSALGGASGIASLAGAGSSLFSALNSGNAVDAATAAKQAAAAQYSANFQPYLGAGTSALNAQMALLGLGGPGGGGASGQPNYAAYVQQNPDILAAYNAGDGKGASMDQFGQWHWNTFGQAEANSGDPNRVYTPYGAPGAQGTGTAASSQQSAIDALKASPLFTSLFHNGEQTALAQAAATGGLRGGNAEASFYNLGDDTLAKVYQQQFQNLGSITGLGENAAAGVGNGQLLGGNATYNGDLGSADANNNLAKTIAGGVSNPQLLQALGLGGGGGGNVTTTPYAQQTYAIPGQAVAPLNLNTTLPQFNF